MAAGVTSKKFCTFSDVLTIIMFDRRWKKNAAFELWRQLCIFIDSQSADAVALEYGAIIEAARNEGFLARLGHIERQTIERLGAYLDGELPDLNDPKLTYTQLVQYNNSLPADKRLNDSNIIRLWTFVVSSGLEIFVRHEMDSGVFKVRRSRIHEMATASRKQRFNGIGEKFQQVLCGWLEWLNR